MSDSKETSITFRLATGDDLERVEPLWRALYEHQKANGMFLEIPADGYQHWAASMKPVLGRFACLLLAEGEAELCGFLAGRIRTLPPYFGGYTVGFISEVYVDGSHRKQGIGAEMVTRAVAWFAENGISRVELQVIMNNEPARRLYRQLGWREELVQMVWQE
jgi:ribosomal protein S18 acetylase RimI-like enzyme